MKLSVIIVNYNVKYFLEVCLHSVYRAMQDIPGEVIVVDNNSADDSCAMVRQKFPQVVLIENKDNTGFSRANNQGVAVAKGEYILFLNPDTVMPEDFLQKMIAYMDAHPKAGAIGPRLIDGKGQYAPDGKKSFPSLSVAIFKTTGLNRIFSKSPYFNKYYAVHIGEHETAAVEGLSGCCMMVRSALLPQIGGAFDEDYFMYCEDVDLCYRIQQAGYENIYYPEATLIHYKGESTKKATLSYVRVFNEALVTFVKKHYSKPNARLFVLFINIGIVLRAILGVVKQVLKVLRMPLFDALILLATLWFMKEFWVEQVMSIGAIPFSSVVATFPVYILLWIVSLYFNGAYDEPYRGLRVIRGMAIGTVIILAYYGLLQPGLRYSRAIIIFSGFIGTVGMLGLHELLHRLGILKFVSYDKLPRKAVIVASPQAYYDTAITLRRVHYAPEVAGRISPATDTEDTLASLPAMKELMYTAGIQEVIFCVNGLTYANILNQMEHCGPAYEYKIHLPGSESFVGSNSAHTSGDLYTVDRRFNLSVFAQTRNKRILDIAMALAFLVLSPIMLFVVKQPGSFLSNIAHVLFGKRTWVGYAHAAATPPYLPVIRPGVLPPYNVLPSYTPGAKVQEQLNFNYAQKYTPATDLNLILNNLKYLGDFSKNILQK
ncbi:MAG: glycosyltransferase [Sphingobacteriales bacterium]|nr:MAG: glycosyltransferase [Sphingobacteriales bacterium]